MVLGSYLRSAARAVVFPPDAPSPLLAIVAVAVNGAVLVSTAGAWQDADEDGTCAEMSKSYLGVWLATDVLQIVLAVAAVVVIRRNAAACDSVDGNSAVRMVLRNGVAPAYALFLLWVVIWVSVTYSRFPSADACVWAGTGQTDLCCSYCIAMSSVTVFYVAAVVAIVCLTLCSEMGDEPRWWHTILLKDLRRRELEALYAETNPESARRRLSSNADTDAEMRAVFRAQQTALPREARNETDASPKKYLTAADAPFMGDERFVHREHPPTAEPKMGPEHAHTSVTSERVHGAKSTLRGTQGTTTMRSSRRVRFAPPVVSSSGSDNDLLSDDDAVEAAQVSLILPVGARSAVLHAKGPQQRRTVRQTRISTVTPRLMASVVPQKPTVSYRNAYSTGLPHPL